MPFLCYETNLLRTTLLPHAVAIRRCVEQGLTVDQCAAYLLATARGLEDTPMKELMSPTGHRAIREVFWMQEEGKSGSLFQMLLGSNTGSKAPEGTVVQLIAGNHPSFLSWVPAAYRAQVESALG